MKVLVVVGGIIGKPGLDITEFLPDRFVRR